MGRSFRLVLVCAALALWPLSAMAAGTIKIGWPMPLSGPASVYGVPVTKGAEIAVADINKKGGVLGKKLELLPRDSKASPDEAVRLARELIIKDGVDFLSGTLTSAEAPAVSTIAKENKIVFLAPVAKTVKLTEPKFLHPYIFRISSNTEIEGHSAAEIVAKWKNVKRLATIAPDYSYGRDAVAAFVAHIKKLRPDIEIVDQEWPKLGEPDFTSFITAQMSKKPDAVDSNVFGGDFVTFVKQATPLGYFKAIKDRMVDGAEVGTVDEAQALGANYPYGIWSATYDPVLPWKGEPAAHKEFIQHLEKAMNAKYGSGWAIQGYSAIIALADAIKKAGSTNSDKVSKALEGLTFQTPVGPRTIHAKTHETEMGEFWGQMVKEAAYPFAVMKNPIFINPGMPTQ
jgi:branched-chain amino acid transport system substrate-binding protein